MEELYHQILIVVDLKQRHGSTAVKLRGSGKKIGPWTRIEHGGRGDSARATGEPRSFDKLLYAVLHESNGFRTDV
ncbi:MAG TPA: hypothetical protein VFS21_23515, partial [Roseiflexaceae bacterium]|nr:hypothetical protein [Roseiflexaceae bacterium]